MQIKKIGGGFLCSTWNKAYGYLSRGRGVKVLKLRSLGNYFKSLYLLCKLMSIGGRDSYFLNLGWWGRLDSLSLTLLGGGYLLFLFCVTDVIIMDSCKRETVCI